MRLSSERSAYSWKPARTLVRSIRKPIPRTSLCLLAFYGGSPRQRQGKSGCDGYSLCASRGLELKISQSSSLLVSQRPVPVNQTCEVRTFPTATDPHRKDSFCLKRLGRSRSYQSFSYRWRAAVFEADILLWLRCHVPMCIALESVAIAGKRRGGGARWNEALTIARGLQPPKQAKGTGVPYAMNGTPTGQYAQLRADWRGASCATAAFRRKQHSKRMLVAPR